MQKYIGDTIRIPYGPEHAGTVRCCVALAPHMPDMRRSRALQRTAPACSGLFDLLRNGSDGFLCCAMEPRPGKLRGSVLSGRWALYPLRYRSFSPRKYGAKTPATLLGPRKPVFCFSPVHVPIQRIQREARCTRIASHSPLYILDYNHGMGKPFAGGRFLDFPFYLFKERIKKALVFPYMFGIN